MIGKMIDQLEIGDSAEFGKTISESDVYLYAGITGDMNPVHINESYAKTTFVKTRICHGMLSAGLFSTILGTSLPGPGTIYLRQEVDFVAPVRIGDTLTANVEVIEKDTLKNRVRLKTTCRNQDGVLVMDGIAVVSPPKASKKKE